MFWPMLFRCFGRQTWPNKELVLVSEDPVDGDPPPGTRIVRCEPGASIGHKMNLGVSCSDSNLFCKWDDDDWYHKDFLTSSLSLLTNKSPSITMVTSHMILFLPQWKLQFMKHAGCPGGTICFDRMAWSCRPFENTTKGEDVKFIERRDCLTRVRPDPLLTSYVLVRHGNNSWNDWCGTNDSVNDVLLKWSNRLSKGPESFFSPEDLRFYKELLHLLPTPPQ